MPKKIINNFSILIATANGSGSQTANTTLLRAFFYMGIPVSGKNIFPSNIQGQPTWYTIRINKKGFTSRSENNHIVIAFNNDSLQKDIMAVSPGGVLIYSDETAIHVDRQDIFTYKIPIKKLAKEYSPSTNLQDYLANMVYVGVLAHLLGVDGNALQMALVFQFKDKEKSVLTNYKVIENSMNWAKNNLTKKDPFYVVPMKKNTGKIMSDGNTAAALGSIFGGVQFAAWYPITPASTLAETLNNYLPQLRSKNGRATYAVVQAEDELAAIGMAIGAGWSGLRAMTSTSGPGLSLMAEYIGLAHYSETPVVIWDIQRVGPSTGLPTRTAQGDLTEIYFLSHGDKSHIILIPGSVNECFEFAWKAFDLAENIQAPIFVLSDLDLGMNQWITPEFSYPDQGIQRGKILWEKQMKGLSDNWGRYKDIDGDAIPYRTLPGNVYPGAAWFGRGTGHDDFARYTEDPQIWEYMTGRLKRKYELTRPNLPQPDVHITRGAKIGMITYGSCTPAVEEACSLLHKRGVNTSFLRIRAIPMSNKVKRFIEKHEKCYVIEANRDGQMKQIISLEFPNEAQKLRSACHTDGLPLTAEWIIRDILRQESM